MEPRLPSNYCGPPTVGVPGTTMVPEGADGVDFDFPPRNANAAPPAAAPPTMARMAIVREEVRDPGSTLVCAIEAEAVRPACDAETRIWKFPGVRLACKPRATASPRSSVVKVRL